MNIKLWVRSVDGQVQTDEIPVEKLDCDKLWPVFGAINVGKKPVRNQLSLSYSIKQFNQYKNMSFPLEVAILGNSFLTLPRDTYIRSQKTVLSLIQQIL